MNENLKCACGWLQWNFMWISSPVRQGKENATVGFLSACLSQSKCSSEGHQQRANQNRTLHVAHKQSQLNVTDFLSYVFFCGDNWWFCLAGLMRDCLCNTPIGSSSLSEWQVGQLCGQRQSSGLAWGWWAVWAVYVESEYVLHNWRKLCKNITVHGWILVSNCAHMNASIFIYVHSNDVCYVWTWFCKYVCVCLCVRSKGNVEVLIPGMQKYKEGNKTAVEWFTSSQRDTESECVYELLGKNKVSLVYNAELEESWSDCSPR